MTKRGKKRVKIETLDEKVMITQDFKNDLRLCLSAIPEVSLLWQIY